MPETHSRLSPSSAYRWLVCPGSAGTGDADEPGEAAELGTLIHTHGADPTLPTPEFDDEDKRSTFTRCLEVWREVVAAAFEAEGEVFQEVRSVSETCSVFGGTADLLVVGENFLHVYDLKTGLGDVSAEQNLQLACYLLLAREKFGPRERYYGTIVQPMRDYEGTYEYFIGDLLALQDRIAECAESDELRAGGHCRYCPLLKSCTTAWRHAGELCLGVDEGLPDDEIGYARLFVEFRAPFERLVDISKEKLIHYMEEGNAVPGWKLANHGARRAWTSDAAAVDSLLKMGLKEEQLFERKLKTPASVEKLGVQLPDEILFQPPASVILARASSHKKAVVPTDGREFDA